MPWEKSFDTEEATDKAITVFMDKGFEGTSMADLIAGMGINKGSLYNAFGSKRELFSRALLRYDHKTRTTRLEVLAALDDPVEAISRFFDSLIVEAASGPDYRGCLVVNTALELPHQSDDVKKIVQDSLKGVEKFFEDMILRGQDLGHIPLTVPATATATALMSLAIGFRVLSRGTCNPDELTAVKSAALRLMI